MNKRYNQLPQVAFSILLTLGAEPRHGYGIMKQVAEDSGGKIKLVPGALYASIKQLVEQNYIREVVEPDDLRRRYYKITGKGRRVLCEELAYYQSSLDLARRRRLLDAEARYA
ncbi:MAG TPA: PadR family transcriptional regulator [Candidatus Saccharimonadales bacterium]